MLTVPKGSTSGKVLRLKGRGFTAKDGKRGDQLVTLAVDVPPATMPSAAEVRRRLERRRQPARGARGLDPPMKDHSIPNSPEGTAQAARKHERRFGKEAADRSSSQARSRRWIVAKRVAIGVYNDGFIHAGNLAYLRCWRCSRSSSSPPRSPAACSAEDRGGAGGRDDPGRLPPDVAEVLPPADRRGAAGPLRAAAVVRARSSACGPRRASSRRSATSSAAPMASNIRPASGNIGWLVDGMIIGVGVLLMLALRASACSCPRSSISWSRGCRCPFRGLAIAARLLSRSCRR